MGAACIEARSPLDSLLGMECYLTASEPVRPSRALSPSNFYVYEYIDSIGIIRPPIAFSDSGGDLYVYLLIKRGVDTYNALDRVRRILRPRRISYYGLKDARATTYQLIVVEKPSSIETYISNRDIEAMVLGRATRHARRGHNAGNCFKINLGSMVDERDMGRISSTLDHIEKFGFIPNYYSYQRFGVRRPITHIAGMGIVCSSYEDALRSIVTGDPYRGLGSDLAEVCREIINKRVGWMNIERIVCREYIESRDPVKAVKSLPKAYLELYISAFLSYVFNLYLSLRWRDHGLSLEQSGDELLLRSPIYNLKIPGVRISTRAGGKLGYVVLEALGRNGFEGCSPTVKRSIVRPLVTPISFEGRDHALEFCLDRGGYATNLLREIFKQYAPQLLSPDLDLGPSYH